MCFLCVASVTHFLLHKVSIAKHFATKRFTNARHDGGCLCFPRRGKKSLIPIGGDFFADWCLSSRWRTKVLRDEKSAKMRKKTANQSHFRLSLSSASGFLVFRDFGRYSFFQIGFSKKAVSVKRELLRGKGDKNGTPNLCSEARYTP